ncbi:ATP-binding protein [Methylomonas sp. AM2-LC]|uniref:AlbA family DNA-binding domain-containing protein n=1 Tax=Methylomonas sp. AM2-LC TaxID=3153301 RepID=UPI003264F754
MRDWPPNSGRYPSQTKEMGFSRIMMKRVLLLMLTIWRQRLKLYFNAGYIGALVGVLILAPSYDYIYAREHSTGSLSSLGFVFDQLKYMVTGRISHDNFLLLLFYAQIGGMLGMVSLFLYTLIQNRLKHIDFLQEELNKDIPSIVRQGEGPYLEFKSSLRWDLVESRVNRSLEAVTLKTITGFLNSAIGGTLLIGVADNGEILGVEHDYQSLKKQNQDGFERAIMTFVSEFLGADLCPFLHILFHDIDGKQVCRVIVTPSPRPVFLEQNNTPKFFVRTGGATRELNIQEALGYVAGRWPRNH